MPLRVQQKVQRNMICTTTLSAEFSIISDCLHGGPYCAYSVEVEGTENNMLIVNEGRKGNDQRQRRKYRHRKRNRG